MAAIAAATIITAIAFAGGTGRLNGIDMEIKMM